MDRNWSNEYCINYIPATSGTSYISMKMPQPTGDRNYLTTAGIKKDYLLLIVGDLEKEEVDPAWPWDLIAAYDYIYC